MPFQETNRNDHNTSSEVEISDEKDSQGNATERFLQLLDSDAKFFTFQTFDDDKERKDSSLARILHGSLDQCWDDLVALNRQGAGVFVTVNQTDGLGRKNKNIVGTRAIFQDDDNGFSGTYPLPPSIEAMSSPGKFQRYWLCRGVDFKQFGSLLDRLADTYGSDPKAKGLTRVLRLPGFFHLKDPGHPHLVRLVEPSPGAVYSAGELLGAFLDDEAVSSSDKPQENEGDRVGLDDGEEARIISALLALPQQFADDRSLWRDIGMALYSSDLPNSRALFDQWSMGSKRYSGKHGFLGSDKYGEAGQETLWKSLGQGYTGPKITLSTLFYHARQSGWIDPKRNYHQTDLGNAQRLVDRHGLNLRYVVEWGNWLVWRDGRWHIDGNFEIERLAKETVESMWREAATLSADEAKTSLRKHALKSEAAPSISAMVRLAKSEKGVPINASQLDADPHLLGVWIGVE